MCTGARVHDEHAVREGAAAASPRTAQTWGVRGHWYTMSKQGPAADCTDMGSLSTPSAGPGGKFTKTSQGGIELGKRGFKRVKDIWSIKREAAPHGPRRAHQQRADGKHHRPGPSTYSLPV